MTCPRCRFENAAGRATCEVCGERLGGTTASVVPTPAATPSPLDASGFSRSFEETGSAGAARTPIFLAVLGTDEDDEEVQSLAFAPRSNRLVSARGSAVNVWDIRSKTLLKTVKTDSELNTIAVSSDGGSIAAAGTDHAIRLWDAESLECKVTLKCKGHVESVAFSPDGRTLASLSSDGFLRLWDPAAPPQKRLFGLASSHPPIFEREIEGGGAEALAFSPEGRVIVVLEFSQITFWDLNGESVQEMELSDDLSDCLSMGLSPDGSLVAIGTGDGITVILDRQSGAPRWKFPALGEDDWINAVVFSPDGSMLVDGCDNGTIRLWDVVTGSLRWSDTGGEDLIGINCIAFAPDGTLLAAGLENGTVKLWTV